jgi:hypothetical protein
VSRVPWIQALVAQKSASFLTGTHRQSELNQCTKPTRQRHFCR